MRRAIAPLLITLALTDGAAPLEVARFGAPQAPLIVGTKVAPPFALKAADGTWHGISIELWRQVAEELGLAYRFEERDLEGLVQGLVDGSLDASVAALTVTAPREEIIDFTHPFHTSGLGIAIEFRRRSAWLAVLEALVSPAFLQVVLTLALVLLAAGALVWLFERRANPEQFGGKGLRGVGAGFWWSAVTMTTVGYGDKSPRSAAGRIVALIWMFTSVIIISSFTAAIASTLTLSQLSGPVEGPADLPKVRVATVTASTSESYLQERGVRYQSFETPEEAVRMLTGGGVDAVVYDAPILRYLTQREFEDVRVLPGTFERQDYAIALREGSALREPVSLSVLRIIGSARWRSVLREYLGQ
jgi:ABC-type amino acid transport substrate-binding protein